MKQVFTHPQDAINARCQRIFIDKLRDIGFNEQLTKLLPDGRVARWTIWDVFGYIDIVDDYGRCTAAATIRIN